MMKKILLNSDLETARFDPSSNKWISRHGKRFESEYLARMHGCTHLYCRTCGALISKKKTVSILVCSQCAESNQINDDLMTTLFV